MHDGIGHMVTPLGRHPPGQTPPTPPRQAPPRMVNVRAVASYWNAFLHFLKTLNGLCRVIKYMVNIMTTSTEVMISPEILHTTKSKQFQVYFIVYFNLSSGAPVTSTNLSFTTLLTLKFSSLSRKLTFPLYIRKYTLFNDQKIFATFKIIWLFLKLWTVTCTLN